MLNGMIQGNSDSALVNILQGSQSVGTYVKAACASILFGNDMKHIHLHASGQHFDKTHNLAGEYYDKVSEENDYLAELALENKENMPNFSVAGSVIPWSPESRLTYDYPDALKAISEKLTAYIVYLEQLRETAEMSADIQSKLDDMVRDWKKELLYKMEQRAK